MTTKITYKQTLKALEAIVEAEPTRTAQCFYVRYGRPECIVGQVVYKLNGKEFLEDNLEQNAMLTGADGTPATTRLMEQAHRVNRVLAGAGYTEKALKLLSRVQRYQDEGDTGGAALRFALAGFDKGWEEAREQFPPVSVR